MKDEKLSYSLPKRSGMAEEQMKEWTSESPIWRAMTEKLTPMPTQ